LRIEFNDESIFLLLSITFLAHSLLWILIYFRLPFFISTFKKRKNYTKDHFESCTVIICAHNEQENLKKNLPFVLRQNNPGYQVIVVDDGSTDHTLSILKKFEEDHDVLTVLTRQKNIHDKGKREALLLGLAHAKNSLICLTDADCHPISHRWINGMQFDLEKNVGIVLGFSPVKKGMGFLNTFARYEALVTAVSYFNMALWKLPYMGVGRNLMFRKEAFDGVKGFGKAKTAGGDDDLLVQKISKENKIAIAIEESSWVYTLSPKNFKAYLNSRSRHVKTSIHYNWYHQLWLGTQQVLTLSFFSLLLITALKGIYFGLFLLLGRWILWALLLRKSALFFKERSLLFKIPILDITQIGFHLLLLFYSPFKSKNSW
jgi:poly-beta-1,6-N-acetyl-D-glucosamine synthase